jgi:Tfp pilus assembly protein PilF
MRAGILFAAALAAAPQLAPAQAQEIPALASVRVQARIVPPNSDEIMALPPELQALVQEKILAPARHNEKRRLELLTKLMSDKQDGLGIEYDSDATRTVAEVFQTRRANCLSFTLLTVALARAAQLKADGQTMERVLGWEMSGDLVMQSSHVNARVSADGRRFIIDVASQDLLVHSPLRPIADERLLAMYYNNRAMELLEQGDADASQEWLEKALHLDPHNVRLWSNAGVLQEHKARLDLAEADFLHAVDLQSDYGGVLSNLVALYEREDKPALVAQWQQRAEAVLRKDPYHQFAQGMRCEKNADFTCALAYYQRAVRLEPKQHLFHFALARAWLGLGKEHRADDELARALELSEGSNHASYQAKLEQLRLLEH